MQLNGLCTPDRAASALATAVHQIEELLDGSGGFFQETTRGIALSADGGEWLAEQLAAERVAADQVAMAASYERFMELNHAFKELVSTWQLSSIDGHSEEDWTRLVEGVTAIDRDLLPVLRGMTTHLPRLARYAVRFARALAAMQAGDTSMLTSPLKDSYHTVWFECHEDSSWQRA